MILFIILGVVVLVTFVVLGVLFFMLSKEGNKNEKAVPVTDLEQLKRELSTKMFEQDDIKPADDKSPEIIPPFVPRLTLPVQEAQAVLEDKAYDTRAQELEDELISITKKADGQSEEAKQLIDTLAQDNESLKAKQAELEEVEQKLAGLEKEASSLKLDNTDLQAQLESTNAKVHLLEEQMAAVKIQMGEEITRANAMVSELKQEKETLLSAPKPEPDLELRQELDALKAEQTQLKQKYEELEKAHQQLQYELIKARAQSSGLERVSFNYKNQLEDFFKKVNAVQVTNDHLSQVKNRLEGMVEEVKLQNEELVKKDQMAQFELEKNRSRLTNLEREYADFKARVQQQQ